MLIYNAQANAVTRTFSKFKEVVYSASYRRDGKLIATGDERGLIKIFEPSTREVLRKMKGHEAAVRVTRFSPDSTHVYSCSDDKTARCWDLPTGKELRAFSGHEDFVRAIQICESNSNLCATGSYDHSIRLWDTRSSDSATLALDHGAPVEAILIAPSGGVLISAGGTSIKVWDLLAGGRLIAETANHQKTITSLCFSSDCSQILAGSLDQFVKIFDVSDYKVAHTFQATAPVLSVALSVCILLVLIFPSLRRL